MTRILWMVAALFGLGILASGAVEAEDLYKAEDKGLLYPAQRLDPQIIPPASLTPYRDPEEFMATTSRWLLDYLMKAKFHEAWVVTHFYTRDGIYLPYLIEQDLKTLTDQISEEVISVYSAIRNQDQWGPKYCALVEKAQTLYHVFNPAPL